MPGDRGPVAFGAVVLALLMGFSSLGIGLGTVAGTAGSARAGTHEVATGVSPTLVDHLQSARVPTAPAAPVGPYLDPRPAGASGARVSSLDLLNQTFAPSPESAGVPLFSDGLAYVPATGWVYSIGRDSVTDTSMLSVSNPATGAFVRELTPTNCLGGWESGVLTWDPAAGLLIEGCDGGVLMGLSPSSGQEVSSVTVPVVSSGPACAGYTGWPVEATSSSTAGQFYVVYQGCVTTPANASESIWTLDTVNEQSLSLVSSVDVATPFEFLTGGAVGLAYDNATGELYLYNGSFGDGPNVAVIDPDSGTVVGGIVADLDGPPSANPMVYDAALGSVLVATPYYLYTVTHHHVSESFLDTAVMSLSLATGSSLPAILWTGHYDVSPGNSIPYLVPTALAVGPGATENLTVFVDAAGSSSRALVYNVSSGSEVANVTALPVANAIGIPSERIVVGIGAASDDDLVTVGGSPAKVTHVTPTGLTTGAGFFGPGNQTFYLGTGSFCGSVGAEGTSSGCPNQTIVSLGSEGSQRFATVPSGGLVAGAYDATTGDFYLLTVCGEWVGFTTGCGAMDAPSELTELSPTGAVLGQTPLTLHSPEDDPGDFSLLLVSDGYGVEVAGTTARYSSLELVNASTMELEEDVELPSGYGGVSLAYDTIDHLALSFFPCFGPSGAPDEGCLAAFDPTTLALVANYVMSGNVDGLGDQRLTYDPSNDTVYLANSTRILIFAADAISAGPLAVLQPAEPALEISYDPTNGWLYELGQNLTVVNATTGATVARTVLQDAAFAENALLEVDTTTGEAAISWWPTPYVDLIPAPGPARYVVSVSSEGLGAGVAWPATLDGATLDVGGAHEFYVPNGSYRLTVGPVPGYHLNGSPRQVSVDVLGTNLSLAPIDFAPTEYPIEAEATSGGGDAPWAFSIAQYAGTPASGPCSGCVNGSSAKIWTGTNGSYHYLLRALVPGYRIQTAAPSGSFAVDGGPVLILFSLVRASTLTLTFHESGLADGTEWCASLDPPHEDCTTAASLPIPDLSPGIYDYRFAPVAGYSSPGSSTGSIALSSANGGAHHAYAPDRYLVSFVAIGLRPHTHWTVSVGGHTFGGHTTVLAADLTDGAYAYAVPPVKDYVGHLAGIADVDGGGVSVLVYFSLVEYSVTFHESGLPSGAVWQVVLDGRYDATNRTTLTFEEPNGTYRYSLGTSALGYRGSGAPHPVRVVGGSASVTVTFRELHPQVPAAVPTPPAGAAPAARDRARDG